MLDLLKVIEDCIKLTKKFKNLKFIGDTRFTFEWFQSLSGSSQHFKNAEIMLYKPPE